MKYKDLDQIMKIEMVSFPAPWSKESYMGELKNSFATYLVAEEGSTVVGYIGIWCVFDEGHITTVAVHPQRRRKGVAKMLIQEAEKAAKEKGVKRIFLEVRPSNTSAQSLYRVMGYCEVGVRRGYYTDNGEDAIVMVKEIGDSGLGQVTNNEIIW